MLSFLNLLFLLLKYLIITVLIFDLISQLAPSVSILVEFDIPFEPVSLSTVKDFLPVLRKPVPWYVIISYCLLLVAKFPLVD